jgi:hypothetical protein
MHCCFTAASLLLYSCFTASLLLLYCCCTPNVLLLCFGLPTVAVPKCQARCELSREEKKMMQHLQLLSRMNAENKSGEGEDADCRGGAGESDKGEVSRSEGAVRGTDEETRAHGHAHMSQSSSFWSQALPSHTSSSPATPATPSSRRRRRGLSSPLDAIEARNVDESEETQEINLHTPTRMHPPTHMLTATHMQTPTHMHTPTRMQSNPGTPSSSSSSPLKAGWFGMF